ncbi:MAG: patatin-like phospholipase family protein [Bacteroidetes bacterium]|nr:patatin-like phospholipase family protein [Bacteroidota bacterium]
MKKYLIGFWFSLPIQLTLLHFRRYQVLLLFWYILFSTIAGYFMKTYAAYSLFLAPEYFNETNALSTLIVGIAIGIFIMSWNITTFILHTKQIKFLATTAQPFLKYCINNAILPILFLLFYAYKAFDYSYYNELLTLSQFFWRVAGFSAGLFISIFIAFVYFFSADKTIFYTLSNNIIYANSEYNKAVVEKVLPIENTEMRVDWFLSAKLHLRKPRDVRHYSQSFLDNIFKRHHIAALLAILLAFIFLLVAGYSSDSKLFQLPAAASIAIFFSVMIGVSGAVSALFRTWSIPLVFILYFFINYCYEKEIIDPRNKAYGLNYQNKDERPEYTMESVTQLANTKDINADKEHFINILNNWKAKQKEDKPILYIINTSGGGLRSAAFTMNALQKIDSLMHGQLMHKTLFINGSSGGMLGAAYYRALYLEKQTNKNINLFNKQYVSDISTDLLNPLFSSFVTRDIVGPIQKFSFNGYKYAKDRGYAFEEKLNENTHGLLDKKLSDIVIDEQKANIPFMFFNPIITRDGRKMIISANPARFLMQPQLDSSHITPVDADAIDFVSFFKKQNATSLRLLSALRMNATFPYALPNVWLPTNPIIDVMDAGLRDNFGIETTLRFLTVFQDWLKNNTSKVVLIQIRDRSINDWESPYQTNSFIGTFTKPMFILQNNWYRLQGYYQHDELSYFANSYGNNFYSLCFQYIPLSKDADAGLSFHLTSSEKISIEHAVNNSLNKNAFDSLIKISK